MRLTCGYVKYNIWYQIQCECGWIGKTSELVTIKFSQGKNCPKCKASFKTVGLPDIEPK